MKNRRLALVAFLLCACMIVGVGYAAVVTSLNVDGKVSYEKLSEEDPKYDEKIHFTGITSGDDEVVRAVVQSGDQTATLSASFNSGNIGNYAVVGDARTVTVNFGVEVVNKSTDTSKKMVVTFGDLPKVSGNVGNGETTTNANFIVIADLVGEALSKNDQDVYTVEVASGSTAALTLSVTIKVPTALVDAINDGAAAQETAFEVILPVTSIAHVDATPTT